MSAVLNHLNIVLEEWFSYYKNYLKKLFYTANSTFITNIELYEHSNISSRE